MGSNQQTPLQGQYYDATQAPPSWLLQLMQFMSQNNQQAAPSQTSYESPAAQSNGDYKKPRHSLSHPDKFTNEDNSQYPQFRSLLEAKLRIDANAIGGEEERIWYGFGRLSEDAAGRIHPWMQYAQDSEEFTVECFLKQLDQAFADPQRQAKALDKINWIQQGKRDFRTYLQEFEQALLEAQGWAWADEVKKGYLRAGLSRELRDRLVTQIEPDKYTEFTAQLRMISDKLQQIKAWDNHRNRNRADNPHNARNIQPVEDSMDWEPTQTTSTAATGRLRQGQQQRARWVDRDEIGRRISEGSCLRCGKQGHMVKDCSLLPAQNPNQQPQTQRHTNKEGPQLKTSIRKPRIAATTAPKGKSVTVADIEEWETDENSEKE